MLHILIKQLIHALLLGLDGFFRGTGRSKRVYQGVVPHLCVARKGIKREMILRTCICTILSRAIPNPFLYFPIFLIVPIFARRRLGIFFFFHKSPSKRESSYIRFFRLLDTINKSNSLFLANGCHLLA